MAKISNKDVLQSYILTTAKYDFSVYEKRIIYQLVDVAQSEVEGLDFRKDCRKVGQTLWGDVLLELPISALLAHEDDKNHKQVKDALIGLSQKFIIYEDSKTWEKINIVVQPKIDKYKSTYRIQLDPKIWGCMLDFTKGFRKYELETAMRFESVYSMRFYEIFSNQKTPVIHTIDELKSMFQITDKYTLLADFMRRVIIPAQKELDQKSPYSFTYSPIKTGKKITALKFFPVYHPEHRDSELETNDLKKRISPAWDLSKNVLDYLKTAYAFETKEIKQNIDLFKEAQNKLDFIQFMSKVKPKANRANNPKGYLINAIKKEMKGK